MNRWAIASLVCIGITGVLSFFNLPWWVILAPLSVPLISGLMLLLVVLILSQVGG